MEKSSGMSGRGPLVIYKAIDNNKGAKKLAPSFTGEKAMSRTYRKLSHIWGTKKYLDSLQGEDRALLNRVISCGEKDEILKQEEKEYMEEAA